MRIPFTPFAFIAQVLAAACRVEPFDAISSSQSGQCPLLLHDAPAPLQPAPKDGPCIDPLTVLLEFSTMPPSATSAARPGIKVLCSQHFLNLTVAPTCGFNSRSSQLSRRYVRRTPFTQKNSNRLFVQRSCPQYFLCFVMNILTFTNFVRKLLLLSRDSEIIPRTTTRSACCKPTKLRMHC